MDRRTLLAGALLLAASCSAPPPAAFSDRFGDWRAQETRFLPPAPAQTLSANPDLAELWAVAQRDNPGLHAAFQEWRAELEQVPIATSLPDPVLSLAGYVSEVETRLGPMQGRVGLSQAFPWFGTLAVAGDQAFAASEAARENFEAARTRLRQTLADSWFELRYLQRAIDVTKGHMDLLWHLEGVSRSQYETGRGLHSDLIRIQVELGKTEDQLRTLVDLKRPIDERINAALGRPVGSSLAWPGGPIPAPPALPADLTTGLAQSSPELRALEAWAEAARHGIILAEKEYYPGFTLGADWTWIGDSSVPGTQDSGADALAVVVGIDLPVRRGRLDAGLARARAREASVEAQKHDLELRLTAELEMALYRYRDAERRVGLYQTGLIAKSEESFLSTLTAYQAAAATFDSVIDAARLLLAFQLELARAEVDRLQAVAKAERFTGLVLLPF